eukprot:UC4_evm2s566
MIKPSTSVATSATTVATAAVSAATAKTTTRAIPSSTPAMSQPVSIQCQDIDHIQQQVRHTERSWKFWRETLGSPRFIVAPMVDQSELPWRLLSRRYGAELCYTPMLHADNFASQKTYRDTYFKTCPEDRPLIVQFCANDPDVLLKAAQLVAPHCDAVDINLGCPQGIARRGHYGSFLQEDMGLIRRLVEILHQNLSVPVTCKIRILDDSSVESSIKYAKMLEKAGCHLLVVHGRTREQKGPNTGLASWRHIHAIKKSVSIPVCANGNIAQYADIAACLAATGVDGVMSSEGNLCNPALFAGIQPSVFRMAEEYLDLCGKYPTPVGWIRAHLFKMWHACLPLHADLRSRLATAKELPEIVCLTKDLKKRMEESKDGPLTPEPPIEPWPAISFHEAERMLNSKPSIPEIRPLHICQPHIRGRSIITRALNAVADGSEGTTDPSVSKRTNSLSTEDLPPELKDLATELQAKINQGKLSKTAAKKKLRYARKRALKFRAKESKSTNLASRINVDSESSLDTHRLSKRRRVDEFEKGAQFIIDCTLKSTGLSDDKLLVRMGAVSQRCAASTSKNKFHFPLHLAGTSENILDECRRQNAAFDKYNITASDYGVNDYIKKFFGTGSPVQIVLMTNDQCAKSIDDVECGKAYVIPALLGIISNDTIAEQAKKNGWLLRRLPVKECSDSLQLKSGKSNITMFSPNQVLDILITYSNAGGIKPWTSAIQDCL